MFRLRARLLLSALSDAKRDLLAKKYEVTPESIEALVPLDPSRNTSMIEWLVRWDKKGQIDSSIKYALNEFQKLKNSPAFTGSKDLNSYTPDSLNALFNRKERHKLKDLSDKEIEKRLFERGLPGAEIVLDKEPWKAWRVSNPKYAMILGSNTSWCTAHEHHATSYCSRGPLLVIYHAGKPFAQAHVSGDNFVILNVKDEPMSLTPQTLKMIEAISDLPEANFITRNIFSTAEVTKSSIKKVKEFAIQQNLPGVVRNILAKDPTWADGYEYLLDRNQVGNLLSALRGSAEKIPEDLLVELIEETPERLRDSIPQSLIPTLTKLNRFDLILRISEGINRIPQEKYPELAAYVASLDEEAQKSGLISFSEHEQPSVVAKLFAMWVKQTKLSLVDLVNNPPHPVVVEQIKRLPEYKAEAQSATLAIISKAKTLDDLTGLSFYPVGTRVKLGPFKLRKSTFPLDMEGEVVSVQKDDTLVVQWADGTKTKETAPHSVIPVGVEYTRKSHQPENPPLLQKGMRVRRGPTWKWFNQDSGGLGTVTSDQSPNDVWVQVRWDHGGSNSYRYWPSPGKQSQGDTSPFLDIEVVE